ncbi:pR36 [rat cytomegalovirus strain Maastricht]|uniref:PR36 n=1 Tax=Rat cytomegalovirus (strain Maastricht) TaxID=79700 RepID=Q9DWF5_RCMVM|nr:pR36 [rat cytomegalovirus strain Maastricht]AAF99134.1 pR36 [rat cytomegalovirus strain Maastricht]WEG71960.1 tegument protein vICA [Murid betaherpesvirus 2]
MEYLGCGDISGYYAWLADAGFDRDRIRKHVSDKCGSLLPLSWPDGVSVMLMDVRTISRFARVADAVCLGGRYVCCCEEFAPIGRLFGSVIEKNRFVVLYGSTGGVYCYDLQEDCVYQLGDSLQSFFCDGLRRMDAVYDLPVALPRMLIDGVMASLMEAESTAVFTSIVAANQGSIYPVSDNLAGVDNQFMLYRGTHGTVTSCSLGTTVNLTTVMCNVVKRMSCAFEIIGALGYKVATAVFHPRLFVLMDPLGAVYGFDNCLNRIYRLADSFKIFTRIVSQKSLFNFRHDPGTRGARRLEKIPHCPHVCNVREIALDPDSNFDIEPQYISRNPSDSFSLARFVSFGEPIGHDAFVGRKNRFFDPSRINRNQCSEGFVTDVVCHYEAALLMRAAYFDHRQITDKLWPDEVDALLNGHPPCLPMARDPRVREALEKMRAMSIVDDDPDLDREDTRAAIGDPPCRRCIEGRREALFNRLRGK